ncbi:uncharacterized protein ISCGN_032554 [Ixodes scapularis]
MRTMHGYLLSLVIALVYTFSTVRAQRFRSPWLHDVDHLEAAAGYRTARLRWRYPHSPEPPAFRVQVCELLPWLPKSGPRCRNRRLSLRTSDSPTPDASHEGSSPNLDMLRRPSKGSYEALIGDLRLLTNYSIAVEPDFGSDSAANAIIYAANPSLEDDRRFQMVTSEYTLMTTKGCSPRNGSLMLCTTRFSRFKSATGHSVAPSSNRQALPSKGSYEALIGDLRLLTNYSIAVEPDFGSDSAANAIIYAANPSLEDDRRFQMVTSEYTLMTTKGFSARAERCLANSSRVVVRTGPFFGGKISVEDTKDDACVVLGDPESPRDAYVLDIDHKLCGSRLVNGSKMETNIIVHENRDIITHNTRRYLVVCSFLPNTYTITASVNLPLLRGKKKNYPGTHTKTPGGLLLADPSPDPNEVFTYQRHKDSNVRDSRIAAEQLSSRTLEKGDAGNHLTGNIALVLLLATTGLVGCGAALAWYATTGGLRRQQESEHGTESDTGIITISSVPSDNSDASVDIKSEDHAEEDESSVVNFITIEGRPVAVLPDSTNGSKMETNIIVHENRDIITHNTRRYLVVCSFLPNTYTITASVNLPLLRGKKKNYPGTHTKTPGGLLLADPSPDPNEVFTYQRHKDSNVRDSRIAAEQLSSRTLEKGDAGNHLTGNVALVLLLATTGLVGCGAALAWYATAGGLRRQQESEHGTESDTGIITISSVPSDNGDASVDIKSEDHAEEDESSVVNFITIEGRPVAVLPDSTNGSKMETNIIVHENRDIITHNTRRYLVVCSFLPNTYTITASVNLPLLRGKKKNYPGTHTKTPGGLLLADPSPDPNEVFTYQRHKDSNVRDSRIAAEQLSSRTLEKGDAGNHLTGNVALVLLLATTGLVGCGAALAWYATAGGLRRQQESEHGTESDTGIITISSVPSDNGDASVDIKSEDHAEEDESSVVNFITIEGRPVAVLPDSTVSEA